MSYVTEVAELFLSRCQYITILSPVDYSIIAEWEKQEIPLVVVFDTLNRVFDDLSQNNKSENIESIGYFHNQIKKSFADWLQNQKDIRLCPF
jgi:hypothetical protein